MKLWKSKKNHNHNHNNASNGSSSSHSTTTSCVPGKSTNLSKNENRLDSSVATSSTTVSGDRAMSPAQSEDSGLAADRGTTYATISLPRENPQAMGIVFLERTDLTYPPVISSLNAMGPAADFLAPGDRIHQVDGIAAIGLTNNHVLSILMNGDQPAQIEIEYSLPEYISQNSLCVTTKLAQITVERENGCLGLTLRGGGDFPLIVTNVRPHGPVFKVGRIKPGDRLLRVDNISLINKSLLEAQQILKCGHMSGFTNLTIEYDVSVMQSVEFSLGPLLIEIERPLNEKLGIILSNYSSLQNKMNDICPAGIYISSILPASIADRCGAVSVGDQILSIDETIIENTGYSPEDVMTLLNANTNRGYTQIQILPAHAVTRKGLGCGNFNTLDSRKAARQRKYTRKSSLTPMGSGTLQSIGPSHSEVIQVILDCSQGSGVIIGPKSGQGYTITHIIPDSVADHAGCIQVGDRLLSINKLYNLDATTIRQILGDHHAGNKTGTLTQYQQVSSPYWVELEIEFDMSDSVIPSQGVFNVKLPKTNKTGLGITVNGTSHGTFVISEVKQGSPAHRIGSLRPGDVLLAVDAQPLQHFNVDALLKDRSKEFTTLTINRHSLPDFLFDTQHRCNAIYANSPNTNTLKNDYNIYSSAMTVNNKYMDDKEGLRISSKPPVGIGHLIKAQSCQPDYCNTDDSAELRHLRRPFLCKGSEPPMGRSAPAIKENTNSMTTEIADEVYNDLESYDLDYRQSFDSSLPPPMEISNNYGTHQLVINVRLEINGGPLGITLSGSEDSQKPIFISGILEGGIAHNSGNIQIGDCLLAVNSESVQGKPLSHATKLLQSLGNLVDLKISRNFNEYESHYIQNEDVNQLQPQAVYAKVQRRPRSPLYGDANAVSNALADGDVCNGAQPNNIDVISNSSKEDGSQYRSFHVTLYKDKVYDDYGFSVSDGLYERGVYINRIRSGGPADIVGLLKPFDRIMQVNDTKTKDFDCCLTVPLIASAGDKIEMILQRPVNE